MLILRCFVNIVFPFEAHGRLTGSMRGVTRGSRAVGGEFPGAVICVNRGRVRGRVGRAVIDSRLLVSPDGRRA